MGKIFQLDLHANELFGWEGEKSKLVVKAIIKGIRKGDEFPPVPIQEANGRFYLYNSNDELVQGGHHRAIGHYLAHKPLTCELMPGEPTESGLRLIPIREIVLGEDLGNYKLYKMLRYYR